MSWEHMIPNEISALFAECNNACTFTGFAQNEDVD